jgi:hypothetical protein
MSIKIKYELTGAGWAEVEFIMPHKHIKIRISYLSNPLPEIINGILNISQSKTEFAEVLFSDEPGEYRLQILKVSENEILLSFYSHTEALFSCLIDFTLKKKPEEILRPITLKIHDYIHEANYQCSIEEFVTALIDAVDNLISNVPIRKYKLIWRMPFPAKAYSNLKALS